MFGLAYGNSDKTNHMGMAVKDAPSSERRNDEMKVVKRTL